MPRKQWRCFFCDEVFIGFKAAAEHFGVDDACEADTPACKIAAHEGHLVRYIRKLEKEVRRYMSEDSDVMRSIQTLEADHRTALVRAEERGYAKGVEDMKAQGGTAPNHRCTRPPRPREWPAKERIEEMAKKYAGSGGQRAFDIKAEREAERERCAKIAEEIGEQAGNGEGELYIARKIADAIRAAP